MLVALALTMGATFNMIQAQCSDDCQCGKTTGSKGIIVDTVKVPDFLLSVWMQSEISFIRSPIVVLFG